MKLVLISVFFAVLFQFPSAANAICKRQEQFEQLQRVCQSIKNQCADVPEQQRLSCQPNIARDSWGILVGCAKGAFQSVKDFVLFLVHIGKALINTAVQTMRNPNGAVNATASLARSGALSASQLGNYVRREFEISKRKMGLLGRIPIASDFAASLEVARKIVGPVIKSIWGAIEGFAEQQVHNFGCYNPEARAHMLCKVATDIFFPPAGAIALLKGGAVLKNFPNLERAIQKLASLVGKDAKAVASTNRATKAETAVRVAAKPAARSGATEKVAKDMHETWRRGLKPGTEKFHPVGETDLLPGENAVAAQVRLEGQGVAGLKIDNEQRLVQDINRPADEVLPSINARNNGAPAEQYVAKLDGQKFSSQKDFEQASSDIHEIWIKNNEWKRSTDPQLFEKYSQLTAEEQLKDLDVVASVLKAKNPKLLKSEAYLNYRAEIERALAPSKISAVKNQTVDGLKALTEKRLPAAKDLQGENASWVSSAVDPKIAVPRYQEMGLKVENGVISPSGRSTALSSAIAQLNRDQGIQLISRNDSIQIKIGDQTIFPHWSELNFLEKPQEALKDVENLKKHAAEIQLVRSKGFGIANKDEYILGGERIELSGSKYGSETDRLIYNLREKQGIKIYLEDAPGNSFLGVSHGDGTISIDKSYALKDSKFIKDTVLHESKHASSDKLPQSDRLIKFFSDKGKLPVPGYEKYMRADEIEARLVEIGQQKIEGNKSVYQAARRTTLELIDAQQQILSEIQPMAILDAKPKITGGGNGYATTYEIPSVFDGKEFKVALKVPEGVNHRKYIQEIIKKRLDYLKGLKQRLENE